MKLLVTAKAKDDIIKVITPFNLSIFSSSFPLMMCFTPREYTDSLQSSEKSVFIETTYFDQPLI